MIIGMSLAGTIGRKSRPARHVRPLLQFRSALHVRLRRIGIMLTAFAAGLLREVRAWRVLDAETAERDARNRRAGRYFDVYGNAVLRLAYSYVHNMADAEDILQETLIRIMKADPHFENEAGEKAYILKTAANAAKNHLAYSRLREADELNEELLAEERESIVGFSVPVLSKLPFDVKDTAYTAIGGELAQIIYYGEDGDTELILRKSPGTEDNSGDYNSYADEAALDINGIAVSLRGNGGLYYLACWQDTEYVYSLSCSTGCDEDTFRALAAEAMGG